MQFPTLIFDVLGTLLDEDHGLLAAARLIAPDAAGAATLSVSWSEGFAEASEQVRRGSRPYASSEELHAEALDRATAALGWSIVEKDRDRAVTFGRRLRPFAEVPAALEQLATGRRLVGLTNAGLTQAFAMSGHAGLRWTTLISGETVRAFKPDPRMYTYAISRLELAPEACLFVAAHPWDLDAAAQHGFRTAYVDRSSSSPETMSDHRRRFDFAEPNLAALAASLE